MHMNLIGKELISERIMEHMKEHLTKRETSTITLQWKQEMDKRTASARNMILQPARMCQQFTFRRIRRHILTIITPKTQLTQNL